MDTIETQCPKGNDLMLTSVRALDKPLCVVSICVPNEKGKRWNRVSEMRFLGSVIKNLLIEEAEMRRVTAELSYTYEELNLLYETSEILSNVFDVEEGCQRILAKAVQVLGAEKGSLMLLDEKKEFLRIVASVGVPVSIARREKVRFGEGIAGTIAKKGKAVLVEDIETDRRFKFKRRPRYKTASFISVPLVCPRGGRRPSTEVIGVLNINDKQSGERFTSVDLKLVSTLARQAALGIRSVKYYQMILNEKHRTEAIFKDMADGLVVTDSTGRVEIANTSACNILDKERDEIIGRSFSDAISRFSPQFDLRRFGKRKAKVFHVELKDEGKGRPALFVLLKITKILTDEGNVVNYVILLHDITTERTEDMMEREFLSLISHKLRTPISVIMGQAHLLLSIFSKGLGDKEKDSIRSIEHQGKVLGELVEKLLNFTTLAGQRVELFKDWVWANSLISEAIGLVKDVVNKKDQVDILFDKSSGDMKIFCDREKMVTVLRNIIENAVKFNPKKRKKVEIGLERHKAGGVKIFVKDNGRGISRRDFKKIFEKFYQVEDYFTGSIEGIGLGLPLSKRIVEAHKGKIHLQSKVGRGSTFVIILPASRQECKV
jgi:PAS domain S-box-containing protein